LLSADARRKGGRSIIRAGKGMAQSIRIRGFTSLAGWRIVSGLVLFVFIATHLLNHAVGLISLEAMEAGRLVFLALWRNILGTVLLYGAIIVHAVLVLYALYRRRSLRSMRRGEALQVVLGLALPPLIALHVIATRGLVQAYGANDLYAYVVLSIWVFEPDQGVIQTVALLTGWVHGCLGLHYWLRLKPWYPRWTNTLYTGALLLPIFALAGFASAGREAAVLVQDEAWLAQTQQAILSPDLVPEARAWVYDTVYASYMGMAALLALTLIGRWVRIVVENRRGVITVHYPEGRTARAAPGLSVLDISRLNGIPHASVCGGRGRCSTCRVIVREGAEHLDPPNEDEIRVLTRVGAPEGVRLACQIRPTHNLTVTPMLPATATAADGHARASQLQGREQNVAVLFADLRAFTQFSEDKLPYDVVFVLNQYFGAMGQAIEQAGGRLDKFIGDGVMALFGLDSSPEDGCRDALNGARAMAAALDRLNKTLAGELGEPLRMGMGIHIGPVIVGEMGYNHATTLTAIGDTVNTASRLEAMTKEFGAQLVVSRRVARQAGVDLGAFPRHRIEVRGRSRPMLVYVVERAADLPDAHAAQPGGDAVTDEEPLTSDA
jgi:adenylate cyclase